MLTRPGMERLSQVGRSKKRLVVGAGDRGPSSALLSSSMSSLGVESGEGRKGLRGKREARCCCFVCLFVCLI